MTEMHADPSTLKKAKQRLKLYFQMNRDLSLFSSLQFLLSITSLSSSMLFSNLHPFFFAISLMREFFCSQEAWVILRCTSFSLYQMEL